MRQNGVRSDDLISPIYKSQLQQKHNAQSWGTAGRHHAKLVMDFAFDIGAKSILDYGCGRATLRGACMAIHPSIIVEEYDPGIEGKDQVPQTPVDLVVATDVLEHIEEPKLMDVLAHIKTLANKGVFLIIATGPSKDLLPNGSNAHLIQRQEEWWRGIILNAFFGFKVHNWHRSKGVWIWLKRGQ